MLSHKILAIDFDEVLHDVKTQKWPELGEEILDAQPTMLKLYRNKNKLIIFSSRAGSQEMRAIMSKWLEQKRIPYHEITHTKPNADFYIDDRAIHFDSWAQVMKELNET